ncbi:hypothetical protein GO014_02140 [Devosia sp. L53-10-65]|uniref:Gfo/Idh/MocA-like oxidoreductase N-terminal domain-containing protein n=1 Tax=Devosia marina TaxID=2683198 RepID=A0A7X3FNT0_9HYPH|nr:hypothetical protein [Devosia marina]
MTIRFGLLGTSRIGTVHARAVSSNARAELIAVADAMPDAASALVGQYGAQVRTIDAIEEASDIDAVIVCTPTDTHADLIERFARAGKAIFCEKPIDLDVERVKTCLRVVDEAGATVMFSFNRHFVPHFQAVKQAIVEGQIDEVEIVTIISRDSGAPPADYVKCSGGIDCVESRAPAAPSGADGFIALALAEAALKSVAEGRAVKVSEVTGPLADRSVFQGR